LVVTNEKIPGFGGDKSDFFAKTGIKPAEWPLLALK
jgi:hypothetical protein